MRLSVAICTYNRADILAKAIDSLVNQTADKQTYEVVIVDNASQDNTEAVARSYSSRLNLHYVYEARQGLSHARNRAIESARGKYLGYIDDDIRLCPDWVERTLFIISSSAPDVFGGPIFPIYENKKPAWFMDKYATVSWGDKGHYLKRNEYLSGCNIVFKKELLERLRGFDPLFGMDGESLGYHEESELMLRAVKANPSLKIYYDPQLIVRHLVRKAKMSVFWHIRRCARINKYNVLLERKCLVSRKESFLLARRAILQAVIVLKKIFAGVFFREKNKYPYFQNYLLEDIMPHLGMIFFYFYSLVIS
jgi:glycosyltransferase involved in cell wall biosynthesis